MKKMKLVMVGNGMAGVRTLEELLKLAPDLYDITVFGAEPHPNYNRILLSPVLAGEQTIDDIVLNPLSTGTSDNGITLHLGKKVVQHRPHRSACVYAEDGTERRIRPPAAGHRLQSLHAAGARQGPGRRDRLPRHRRHRCHDRCRRHSTSMRWSSAAACSGWKRPTA